MLRVPSIGPITRYPVSLFKGFPLCEFLGEALVLAYRIDSLIPSPVDQDRCAQLRRPMDMIVHGWSTRRFQAKQQ
jgi:hypothetical protein